MTNPNTFEPMIRSINEMLISGSGTTSTSGSYTIATGSFSLDWWYHDRANRGLAIDVLSLPQLSVRFQSFADSKAWPRPNTKSMYDVEVIIDMAYNTDSKVLKSRRDAIRNQIMTDAHKIVKTLQYPGNLRTTADGTATGIVGGLLEFEDSEDFEWDSANSLLKGSLNFLGRVVLTNVD